ncbi:MAG: response regulator transcription factor [Variovorax sp.]|nr:MAG: response regulator transcription factor [Variovorax sp.]
MDKSYLRADAEVATVRFIDADALFRRGVKRILCASGYRVADYGSVGEFLLAGLSDVPGCVLLDIRLPGPSGLDLQEMLRTVPRPLPVVVLTGKATVHETVRAMKAGAVDFLLKPVDGRALLSAVGKAVIKDAREREVREGQSALQAKYATLSPREREVLAMLVEGALNKQIGAQIGAAERTVKAHRAHLMVKMGVRSVAALVRVADRLNERHPARDGLQVSNVAA